MTLTDRVVNRKKFAELAPSDRPPRADLVTKPRVSKNLRREAVLGLRKLGLTPIEIRRLMRHIRRLHNTVGMRKAAPTAGADKKRLKVVLELAEHLANAMAGSSRVARAVMTTASVNCRFDIRFVRTLEGNLAQLSAELKCLVDAMPDQGRAFSQTGIVDAMYEIVGARLGAVSTWPETEFFRACRHAFKLAGYKSPHKAILAWIDASLPERHT